MDLPVEAEVVRAMSAAAPRGRLAMGRSGARPVVVERILDC